MKKLFLLTLLMTFAAFIPVKATTLKITVDKAANVTITDGNGWGTTLTLQNGLNTFENVGSERNPFVITANPGAEITEVIYNDNPLTSYDGVYRFGVGGPETTVTITTTGEGVPPAPVEKATNFNVYAQGQDVFGAPYTLLFEKDGEWLTPEAGDYGYKYKVPENAMIKITPEKPYEIVSATIQTHTEPIEVTRGEDGSITFPNTIPDFYNLTLEMKPSEDALKFTIEIDYPGNINAFLEWQRTGEHPWQMLELATGIKTFVIESQANPLEFIPVEGGEILQVLRNGEVQQPIGWGGTGGYVFSVSDGDSFSISTRGPEIGVKVVASDMYNATLDAYYFTLNDGSVIKLTGREDTLKGRQGEYIYVSGRPGTDYQMLMGSNGAETAPDWKSWFRMTPGADGQNPVMVTLYGNRDVTGVVVDVDAAARVNVTQEGGRGQVLSLSDGKNQFNLSDLKNALAISSTAGNQILSVTLNGDPIAANAQGLYMVTVEEASYVQIRSRKAPVDAALSFTFNEGADINNIRLKVNDLDVAPVSPLVVKSYSVVTVAPAPGYTIENLSCDNAGILIQELENSFLLTVSNADITAATLALTVTEMQPSEGNAIVVTEGDELLIKYSELEYIADEDRYARVKALVSNSVNEVKIGNYVQIYRNDSQTEWRYIKVNGEELPKSDLTSRAVMVKIEERTVIEAEVFSPTYVYSQETKDLVKHVSSGIIKFEVDGQQVDNFYAEPGMTVKLIPVPYKGYIFDHIELFYPTTMAADGMRIEGDTYTFTQEDCNNNFLLFLGVFNVDENEPIYKIYGSNAWLADSEGKFTQGESTVVGQVVILLNDGSYAYETTGIAGDVIHLEVTVNDPEIFQNYEVGCFSLATGFPDNVVPADYTIRPEDANAESAIWINALVVPKGTSVDTPVAQGTILYNPATAIVSAEGEVVIYAVSGEVVVRSESGEASVGNLPAGVYIARSGNDVIKFVKR